VDDRLSQFFGAERRRLRTGAAVVLVLAAVAVAVLVSAVTSAGTTVAMPVAPFSAAPTTPTTPPLLVHVLGAVRTPGLYSLPAGARVVDALTAAGGLADDADPAGVNLARRVGDGEQLTLPRVGEAPPAAASAEAPGRIDLNTATPEQLESLPGIGPALAARIVSWREENGGFSSADDLLEVPGLGEKSVDALRDLVLP
jgi:competence protein ComEA